MLQFTALVQVTKTLQTAILDGGGMGDSPPQTPHQYRDEVGSETLASDEI